MPRWVPESGGRQVGARVGWAPGGHQHSALLTGARDRALVPTDSTPQHDFGCDHDHDRYIVIDHRYFELMWMMIQAIIGE